MDSEFTKLYKSIIFSSVWSEPNATRIVWITLLAMSNENGDVHTSTPGLASAAHVTLAECEAALSTLSSPDKYSKSKEKEGRRIEEIEGGWHIINRNKYRDIPADRTEYWRDWKRRRRAESKAAKCPQDKRTKSTASTVDKVDKSTLSTQTETETEKEYSYNHSVNEIETKDSIYILTPNETNTKKENIQEKNFASTSQLQIFVLKLTDLFALDPNTSDYTAMVNLARNVPADSHPAIIQIAIDILDKSTIKNPLAAFFATLKRENIYIANHNATNGVKN